MTSVVGNKIDSKVLNYGQAQSKVYIVLLQDGYC